MVGGPDEIFTFQFYIFHSDAAASLVGTLIIGGMTVTSVRVAGAKTNDTNQIENGEWIMDNVGGAASTLHSPLSILHSNSPLPVVADNDIARGWRVISVSSNALMATTFTMPEGATVWEDARDFGAGWRRDVDSTRSRKRSPRFTDGC